MNTPNNSQTVTFFEFLGTHDIQIPVIQRDYVQGRALTDTEKEKRDDFAQKLMDALLPDDAPCHLDFVYGGREGFGNTEAMPQNAPFLPLDGQQRLTTLFLLHWVMLQKNAPAVGDGNEADWNIFRDRMGELTKFTYKTRISSGRFCQKLTELQAEPDRPLRVQIAEKYWYDTDMQADPTVKAMMQMLALMEEMLESEPYRSQKATMLAKLYDASNRRITFDVLDMNQYNLTDGLYVKMNARGKELTAFENWKASFIDLIGRNDQEEKARFSYSIEHEWNDLFWKIAYRAYLDSEKYGNGKRVPYPKIDDAFMNFFTNLTRLFFFISPGNQSLNAEDYKPGLWSTVNGVYEDHKEFRRTLFDMLDTLHEIDAANTSIHQFFASIFTNGIESGKVRLFDSSTDLFEAACSSDKFSANHILLFAVLSYCMKHKMYIPDEKLLIYARFCRNYLYEHNYFNTADVSISPQIRVNEMAQYLRFFDALASDADPLVSLREMELKDDYALREKSKLAYYQNSKVLGLVEMLEDLEYTYGNLSAFTSVLEICMADEAYCANVWNAMDAFIHAPALTKAQLFVALGYRGIEVRNCSYGKAVFLGGEYKGVSRWMVHFRRKYDTASPFNAWMKRYVEAFSQENNIETLVTQHIPTDKHSTAYYLLKYPDMLAAQVSWKADRNQAPFYFAMMKPWEDLDMIAIHSFSSHPLNNAYQVCPMANAVAHKMDRFKKYNDERRIGYSGQFANKAGIVINEFRNAWDKIIFSMCFGSWDWIVTKGLDQLPASLLKELHWNGEYYALEQNESKDLVETAVDFMNKVLDDFEQRGLL